MPLACLGFSSGHDVCVCMYVCASAGYTCVPLACLSFSSGHDVCMCVYVCMCVAWNYLRALGVHTKSFLSGDDVCVCMYVYLCVVVYKFVCMYV